MSQRVRRLKTQHTPWEALCMCKFTPSVEENHSSKHAHGVDCSTLSLSKAWKNNGGMKINISTIRLSCARDFSLSHLCDGRRELFHHMLLISLFSPFQTKAPRLTEALSPSLACVFIWPSIPRWRQFELLKCALSDIFMELQTRRHYPMDITVIGVQISLLFLWQP